LQARRPAAPKSPSYKNLPALDGVAITLAPMILTLLAASRTDEPQVELKGLGNLPDPGKGEGGQ